MKQVAFWLAFLIACIVVGTAWVNWDWRRKSRRLLTQRENPSQSEFIERLVGDGVDRRVAEGLWDTLLPEWAPILTPHLDDNPLIDLPFDPSDPEDWQDDFCTHFGLDVSNFSDWPAQTNSTVGNMAKWYSDELGVQQVHPSQRHTPAGT